MALHLISKYGEFSDLGSIHDRGKSHESRDKLLLNFFMTDTHFDSCRLRLFITNEYLDITMHIVTGKHALRFPSNSKASALELIENLKSMFSYYW